MADGRTITKMAAPIVAGVLLLVLTSVSMAQGKETWVIDFEGLAEGQVVSDVSYGYGITGPSAIPGAVTMSGTNSRTTPDNLFGLNTAVIFDATCEGGCSGGDDDLYQPDQGNVVIVAENLDDDDAYYSDDFRTKTYDGSYGELDWQSDWTEINDDDSPKSGSIRVTGGGELRFQKVGSYGGIERRADLSDVLAPRLKLDYRTRDLDTPLALSLLLSSDGDDFTEVLSFTGHSSSGSVTYDLSQYASGSTTVRFQNLGGEWSSGNKRAYVDNVQITDGWVDDPDDEGSGDNDPMLEFDFSELGEGTVEMESVTLLDVENAPDVYLYDGDTLVHHFTMTPTTDGGKRTHVFGPDGQQPIDFMRIELHGSGALDDITFKGEAGGTSVSLTSMQAKSRPTAGGVGFGLAVSGLLSAAAVGRWVDRRRGTGARGAHVAKLVE